MRTRIAFAAIGLASFLTVALGPVANAEPSPTTVDSAAVPAPYDGKTVDVNSVVIVGADGKSVDLHAADGDRDVVSPRLGCKPITHVPDPHISKNKVDVSAHASWDKGTCTKDKAKVTEWLLEHYTDGSWRIKASNVRVLPPYKKTTAETNVRTKCQTKTSTGWMNLADVDVRGQVDDGTQYNNAKNVNCRVS